MPLSTQSLRNASGLLFGSTGSGARVYPRHSLLYSRSLYRVSSSSGGGGGGGGKMTTGPSFSTSATKHKETENYPAEHNPDSPENRFSINTDRGEYSKSGTDNAVAAMSSAWDISNLTPEEVREASDREAQDGGDGSRVSPLEVSPANQEVSKSTDEDGRGESVVHGPSRRVSPKKGKRVDYGGAAIESPSGHDDMSKV